MTRARARVAPVEKVEAQFYTTAEVATLFRVTPATVRSWVRQNKLTCVRINNQLKITRTSVEKLAQFNFGGRT